jgi:hypothetical protein
VRLPTEEERLTGAEPLTQFGRMCAQLGIRIIPASSPQAKGRIERNHGTQQDRLVKKLRRQAIADVAAANAFLEAEYWTEHNRRFARSAASAEDFHVSVPRGVRLDAVFRLEHTRTVSNDWVVRYANRYFQIERQSQRPPARSTVRVYEAATGQIEIRSRDRAIRWTEIRPDGWRPAPVPVTSGARAPAPPRLRGPRAGADHPWRQGYRGMRPDVPIWRVADQ